MNLKESLKKTIEESKDIVLDYSQKTLESIIESDAVKQIPFVKTCMAIWTISNQLSMSFEIKKILNFLDEQDNNTDTHDIIDGVISHSDYSIHVEEIIIILNRQDSVEKARIIGKLFKSLLKRVIKRQDFLLMCSIIEKSFLNDLLFLKNHRKSFVDVGPMLNPKSVIKNDYDDKNKLEIIQRLKTFGLVLSIQYILENNESLKEKYGKYKIIENNICSELSDKILEFI